jgi:TetR/AcrR family transcriptional repressor of mexJK operon
MNKKTARIANADSTDKRQEVLEVASTYFLSQGYDGASVNEMARRSGISKESIYRYFSSKAVLFEAVIDKELEQYQEQLNTLNLSAHTVEMREALMTTAETILSVLTSDRTLAMRRLIFQQSAHSSEVG